MINVSNQEFRNATEQAGIAPEQSAKLWDLLNAGADQNSDQPKFNTLNVIYYLGALIIIGAMGWFMTRAWETLGGMGIFAAAALYAVAFLLVGNSMWKKPHLKIPAGLLITTAVCMVPLAVYGLERWTGFWPDRDPGDYTNFHPYINGSWLFMEIATVLAGIIALRIWRFPFLTAPIAYALWFMSMDLADFLLKSHPDSASHEREFITMTFGFAMLVFAYVTDLKERLLDLSFWGYVFGVMAFWGGLTAMGDGNEVSKFFYCLINLALMFLAIALKRRVFIIFGSLGIFIYLYHLADEVFRDSLLFPVALSLLGIGIIFLGILYQKRNAQIHHWFSQKILVHIGGAIPQRAHLD